MRDDHLKRVLTALPEEVTPTDRAVLMALAMHADGEGRNAHPSQATVAGYTGLARETIARSLKNLRELEIIVRGTSRSSRRPHIRSRSQRAVRGRTGTPSGPISV